MTRLLNLFRRTPSTHASNLARHGAKVRRDAWTAKRDAKTRQLREECGLPPVGVSRGAH